MNDAPSITCPQCKWKSYNADDIEKKYCGHCRMFHEHMVSIEHWYRTGMSELELKVKFPSVPWREAVPITVTGNPPTKGLGCRLCIAMNGLKAAEVGALPQTAEAFQKHLEECHGEKEAQNN